MTKPYTISIIVSGEQGQVMRVDRAMPLPMIDVLKEALDKSQHYETIAAALRTGFLRLDAVCANTGLSRADAKRLFKIAGAVVVHRAGKVDHWGIVEKEAPCQN